MKKPLLIALSILFPLLLLAQNSVSFQPKWKVGDKRTATITTKEVKYKDGELTEDDTEILTAQYEVLKETETAYTVRVTLDNVVLSVAASFYDKIGEDLKKYKDLVLLYQVNKIGGTADLTNWKEAQAFIKESFGQMEKVVKKKNPDMAGFIKLAFNPILAMFDSKEAIEGYMTEEIKLIMLPFTQSYVVGDTLKIEDNEPNPFNPAEEIASTHLYLLNEKDLDEGLYTLDYSLQLDMSGFVAMMKDMMRNLGNSMEIEDSTMEKTNAELESLNFDMTNNAQWLFNANTSWPISVSKTAVIIATSGKGESRKTIDKTAVFK